MAENSVMKDSFLQSVNETFLCKGVDVKTYSPLTLAFLGDCVYDLIFRTALVQQGNCSTQILHKRTSSYVKAEAQSVIATALQEFLTQEEQSVYRRGRNAKSHTTAKNASVEDYRKATGLEALIGYLYLKDEMDRILFLVKRGMELTGIELVTL